MLEKNWLELEFVDSEGDGDISIDIDDEHGFTVRGYWSVEEARRIVDAINAAIAYVESSKGGAQ